MVTENYPKPRVIGLLGRAGSGKTTAGIYLVEKYHATRVSFAAPLKRLAQRVMGFTDEQIYGPHEVKEAVDERYGFSATEYLQKLGNGAREEIRSDVWVTAALEDVLKIFEKDPSKNLFVIDDCRYVNEAEAISTDDRFSGHVIKLVCPDGIARRDPKHPSEAQVDEVPESLLTHVITSKMSPESVDLKEKIDAVVKAIFPDIGKELKKSPFPTTPVSMP